MRRWFRTIEIANVESNTMCNTDMTMYPHGLNRNDIPQKISGKTGIPGVMLTPPRVTPLRSQSMATWPAHAITDMHQVVKMKINKIHELIAPRKLINEVNTISPSA